MPNRIMIVGRLGNDPELASTKNGNTLVKFSIASQNSYQKDNSCTWFNCACFSTRQEFIQKYFKKGSGIIVEGELSTYESNGKTYNNVNVDWVTFPPARKVAYEDNPETGRVEEYEDDLPF